MAKTSGPKTPTLFTLDGFCSKQKPPRTGVSSEVTSLEQTLSLQTAKIPKNKLSFPTKSQTEEYKNHPCTTIKVKLSHPVM